MFSHIFTLLRKGLRPIIAALLFTVLCCGGSKERTVNARGGLYMRQAPRLNAKSVELLPNGAKVQFIEEASQEFTLDGLVGKWTKIKNLKTGSQGWVFGGYLEKPAATEDNNGAVTYGYRNTEIGKKVKYKIISGADKTALIRNASAYDSIDSRQQDDISVTIMPGGIAIVESTIDNISANCRTCTVRFKALWLLRDGVWIPHPLGISGISLTFLDLNGDGIQDIVTDKPYHEHGGPFNVYMGQSATTFSHVQKIENGIGYDLRSHGRCNGNVLNYKSEEGSDARNIILVFDCIQNKFVSSYR
jgi:hypothetical protein